MIVFYGPHFLPDVPALSLVFIAWYFLLRFLDRRQTIFLWISAFWFCLAMLLKITSALSFIAIGGWGVFELLFLKKEKRIFTFRWKHFIPFLLGLIPVILWYLYVEYYNRIHLGHLSFHGIWPVWNTTGDQYDRIIHALDKTYFKEFFLPYTQYLTLVVWFVLLIRIKSLKPVFRYFILVLPVGFFAQLLLWFQVLEGHDYYMINLLVVFVAVWALFLTQLNKLNPKIKNISYGIAVLFFLWNALICQNRIQKRYEGWKNEMYHNIKPFTENRLGQFKNIIAFELQPAPPQTE